MKQYLFFALNLLLALEGTSQAKGDYMWQIGQNSHPQENPYALSMVLDFNVLGIIDYSKHEPMTIFSKAVP